MACPKEPPLEKPVTNWELLVTTVAELSWDKIEPGTTGEEIKNLLETKHTVEGLKYCRSCATNVLGSLPTPSEVSLK
jgi:hypothetical protein